LDIIRVKLHRLLEKRSAGHRARQKPVGTVADPTIYDGTR